MRKKDDANVNVPRGGYSDDPNKNIFKYIGKQIAKKSKSYNVYSRREEMSQQHVNHCMSLHLKGDSLDPYSVFETSAELFKHLNGTRARAYIATVDVINGSLTGNSNIWEVSLEEGRVRSRPLFSGYVVKLENKTASHR